MPVHKNAGRYASEHLLVLGFIVRVSVRKPMNGDQVLRSQRSIERRLRLRNPGKRLVEMSNGVNQSFVDGLAMHGVELVEPPFLVGPCGN